MKKALWTATWEWLARPSHVRSVHTFRVAAERGDDTRLATLLDPDVAVVVESADAENPTIAVVKGAHEAVTVLRHGMATDPNLVISERPVNSQAGLVLERAGEVTAAITIDFSHDLISLVWVRLRPSLLRHGQQG
ncbi:hypothetical protein N1027_09605 [Herbiconiux sp. CPCC 205763]|uniref:Uncharacterized protein n=1 Tax=Herbiconiux aconitum TaxID=2970913 RepID=A0ABT2GQA0_9MICO|nr:hypothetical protein [Herbiconiux aconitum]MCS5718392.1 hypothetical protein [Herbiconiux aconitum]